MKSFLRTSMIIVTTWLSSLVSNAYSQVAWSPIGPGGGGWLSAITVVDDASHTVYVGCDVGGIYVSADHGDTWEIRNTGLSIYYVQDIAYDPLTPSTLYAATRGGIYKSVDGGEHWDIKRAGFPPVGEFSFSAPISDIVVDPNNRNIIYAGIGVPRAGYELDSYHWETAGSKGSIYKSTDFGEHWTLFHGTGIDTSAMIYSLALDPNNSSVLYAATSGGIYKSNTAGATWVPKNSGLPHPLTMTLAIDPNNSEVLYVTLWAEPGSPTWEGGVYKSLDGGSTWAARNDGLPQVVGPETGFTSNFPTILIDEHDTQTLYVGNTPWTPDPGIYKTTDGGTHWAWISMPEPPDENMNIGWIDEHGISVKCMAIDPNDSERLYFGTSTHLFRTEDAGGFWEQVYSDSTGDGYWQGHGLETTCVQDIAVDPTDSNNIYVGYWDMGFLKSTDGGTSFKRTFSGMNYTSNTFSIVVDPADPSVIYAATGWWESNEGEVCKSVDYGEHWTVLGNGIPDAQVWSISLDETSPPHSRTLYAASYDNGIYKTTNDGQDWFPINSGLGVDGNLQVRKVVVDPNNPAVLYAGIEAKLIETDAGLETLQGGLYRSTNAGLNWTRLDVDLPQISVWDIEVDPSNPQVIYTAVSDEYDHTQHVTCYGGVYKSDDGGASWMNNHGGFGAQDNLNVLSLAICPANSSVVYAVTSDAPFHDLSSGRGIFKSTDAGGSWTAINSGLGVLYFDVITIDPSNPTLLYAGSSGNGILRGVDSDIVGIADGDLGFSALRLAQNTPNPFGPRTVIRYTLPSRKDVVVRIYTAEGRVVRTLWLGNRTAGTHTVPWSGRDDRGCQMDSGLYLYRLITDRGTVTRKMTMLR